MSGAGPRPVTERLRVFVAEAPWERAPILEFVQRVARETVPGARVLDIGAGDAPYAELFEHVDYVTLDWEHSPHEGAQRTTVSASADDLPFAAGEFDAVLLTQVLEHVRRPDVVLAEVARVLRPGGQLYATVPFAWELHEEPHDYWRFSPYALRALAEDAGLEVESVEPRSDSLTTLAQLMVNVSWTLNHQAAGQSERRSAQLASAADALRELAPAVATLAPLDQRRALPLGYVLQARRAP